MIAAPDTIQALGHWQILPRPGSVLYLVGIHGYVQHWLRPVQFVLGLGAGAYACWRRPWVSAPLAAMAMRVVTDPFEFGYYGIGPLLVAYIYDCSEQRFGGYPVMTAVTAVLEFGLPEIVGFDSSTAAVAKIAWAVIALAVALRPLPAQASSARSSHGDEWARGLPSTP